MAPARSAWRTISASRGDDVTLAVAATFVRLRSEPVAFDLVCRRLASFPLDFLFPKDVAKACAKHGVTTLARSAASVGATDRDRLARRSSRTLAETDQ